MSDVSIKLDHVALRGLDRAAVRALEMTAEAVHTDMVQAQVIPFKQGHLQNDSTWVDTSRSHLGEADLVFSTPYSRRLFYHPEYNFSHEENPNAKGHWTEDWEPGGSREDFAQTAFAKLYKREAGT